MSVLKHRFTLVKFELPPNSSVRSVVSESNTALDMLNNIISCHAFGKDDEFLQGEDYYLTEWDSMTDKTTIKLKSSIVPYLIHTHHKEMDSYEF